MAIPAVTREYTPGACRNSRKLMSLPPCRKIRTDSPAFRAEVFHVPNPRRKEPRFSWWNWREPTRTLSQQEKKTDVTSGMKNRLVCPKSTQDEAQFPFIESIAISHSTSYTKKGLTSLKQSRDSLRHPSQVYRNINFSKATGWKIRSTHIVWRWELIPCLQLKRSAIFPQAPQDEFFLRNMYVRVTLCFMLKAKWTPRCPD